MFPIRSSFALLTTVAVLLFVSACTKKESGMTPEEVLETYVKIALNAKSEQDKKSLEEYLTGEALKKLKLMGNEEFLEKLVKPEFKFVSFLARDQRQENNGGISLVYELTFENKSGDTKAKLINRKIAYLKRATDNSWKIFNTRNIKSFVEMKDGLDVMNFKYP